MSDRVLLSFRHDGLEKRITLLAFQMNTEATGVPVRMLSSAAKRMREYRRRRRRGTRCVTVRV
jgi:hypothetical protein